MENRLIELEKRVAFLEHLIEELNEALVDQGRLVTALQTRLNAVSEQVKAAGGIVKDLKDETPPPHY